MCRPAHWVGCRSVAEQAGGRSYGKGPIAGRLQRNVRADFPDWHRGRPWFLLWALDLDQPLLQALFRQAQQHLAPWLLHAYRRQPHVTLGVCGFPQSVQAGPVPVPAPDAGSESSAVVTGPHLPDACTASSLQRQISRLAKHAVAPFSLTVGGAGSFTSAPFLAVQQAGELAALRGVLGLDPALQHLQDYLPHVTLGLYREAWSPAQLQEALDRVDALPYVQLRVRHVSLMAYAAGDVGGPLLSLGALDLASRRWHWHPAASRVPGTGFLYAD